MNVTALIFGTVLLHLNPEITEVFAEYQEKAGKHVDYPVMVGFGFMLSFLLEKGAGSTQKVDPSKDEPKEGDDLIRDPKEDDCCDPSERELNEFSEPVSEQTSSKGSKQAMAITMNTSKRTSTTEVIMEGEIAGP